jgi:hypothetical protein
MRKSYWLVGICLCLCGCASQAQIDAYDDSKCTSYGSRPGDPAYVQCRAQLDAARTQATATAIAGMNAIQPAPPPAVAQPLPLGSLSGRQY